MDIKYLTLLNNNASFTEPSGAITKLLPISESEIAHLETLYNGSQPFPQALKELLTIAGSYCHVLDYGLTESQEEMQEDARGWLTRWNRSITRRFFVIDIYNAGDQFLFVYLGEGTDDPMVYGAILYEKDENEIIKYTGMHLTEFIDYRLKLLLSGRNPF